MQTPCFLKFFYKLLKYWFPKPTSEEKEKFVLKFEHFSAKALVERITILIINNNVLIITMYITHSYANKLCLHINVLTRKLEVEWYALREVLCPLYAPHTLLYKLYP